MRVPSVRSEKSRIQGYFKICFLIGIWMSILQFDWKNVWHCWVHSLCYHKRFERCKPPRRSKTLLEPGPRGTPGGEAAQEAVYPRNRSIRPHLVTKCTVKQVSNQSVPSEQLKHALNARKQSKTSAKRAKTVHLTRKMAKARQPIALSLETLSNQSMNESKASTIGRFTGLSSVYPQLHNRDTFSVLNSFNRSLCSKEQASKPTTRIQDNWTAKTWFH